MDKELKCPKCGSEKRVKSGFKNKKQRYLCKECGCNYTGGQNGYPEHIKKKLYSYIWREMGLDV